MNLPGFDAEAALGGPLRTYRMRGRGWSTGPPVVGPAQSGCERRCFRRICGWWGGNCSLSQKVATEELCRECCP